MNTESRCGTPPKPGCVGRAWRVRAAVVGLALLWGGAAMAVEAKAMIPEKQNPLQGKGLRPMYGLPVQGGGVANSVVAPGSVQRGGPTSELATIGATVPAVNGLSGSAEVGPIEALGEIRPGPQALKDSLAPGGVAQRAATSDAVNCEVVSLSSPGHRPDKTWMDLSGDGLIVTAVDRQHVEAALGRGWRAPAAGAGPVRRCMALGLVEDLLKPAPRRSVVATMALVKVDGGWRLEARDTAVQAPPSSAGKVPARPTGAARLR